MRNASTIGILIGCLIIVFVTSLFCGAYGIGDFSIGDEISEPDVWDILTFAGGGFWSLISFSIDGAPIILTLIVWLLVAIGTISIVFLIRGV